jgi:hypothetical protein
MNIRKPKRGLKKYDEKNTVVPSIKNKVINVVKKLNCLPLNNFGNTLYR